jgi:tungstate transport system ATP-binding protein
LIDPTATQPVLTVRHLRKRFGARVVLDIPELALQRGSCTVLSGRNGSGKTTLLKILAGLEAPDTAEMVYAGESLPWHAACRRIQGRVIYLHQYPYLFDRSVTENIAYGLRQAGCARAEAAERARHALEWAGLAHLAERDARALSGGERQRVALTRAWVLAPQVLLLDEPLASLDQESREHTYFLIRRLRSDGIALLITSHELQHIAALGDRHLHLQDGALQVYNERPAARPRGEAPEPIRRPGGPPWFLRG